jgi:CheY-like chemotaxis protein
VTDLERRRRVEDLCDAALVRDARERAERVRRGDLAGAVGDARTTETVLAAKQAALLSGSLALPPGPIGMLTVLPDLYLIWKTQRQMVADMFGLYGRSAELTRTHMLYCLFRHAASHVLRDLAVRTGQRVIVQEIASGALMEDGSPVLIVDTEDMIRSMEKLAHGDRLNKVRRDATSGVVKSRKRVLVVDDNEDGARILGRLLKGCGYHAELTHDGPTALEVAPDLRPHVALLKRRLSQHG